MAPREIKTEFWRTLLGIAFVLATSISVFSMGSNRIKTAYAVAVVVLLYTSLVYFQLRFYREGDRKQIRSGRKLPVADGVAAPSHLRSPYHRAVWENLEMTRRLMRYKEEESSRLGRSKEKLLIGLPHEEEILFVSDRSWLFFWPVAVCSLLLLSAATYPFGGLPATTSFVCLIAGFSGLLILAAAKSHTRYYLTNFRILIKKQFPWGTAHWSALNYSVISLLSRKKRAFWDELSLRSDTKVVSVKGLTPHEFETFLGILRQELFERERHFARRVDGSNGEWHTLR